MGTTERWACKTHTTIMEYGINRTLGQVRPKRCSELYRRVVCSKITCTGPDCMQYEPRPLTIVQAFASESRAKPGIGRPTAATEYH